MPFSRRVEERRQEREQKRRQAELDRRQEEDLQRQKEEQARSQALEEARQRDAAFEAARLQREAQLQSLRERKRLERRAAERQTLQQQEQLEEIRAAKHQELSLLEEKLARMLALRQQQAHERQDDRQQAELAAGKRQAALEAYQETSRQERAEEERLTELAAGQRRSSQQAQLDKRRAAILEARRVAEQRQAAQESARQEKQAERLDQERQTEKREAAIEEARQARLDEQQATEQEVEKQAAQQAERTDQKRQAEKQAAVQDESRASAISTARQQRLDENLARQRQSEKHQSTLNEARQARTAERRQLQKDAASQAADRHKRLSERRQTENDEKRRDARLAAADSSRPPLPNTSAPNPGGRTSRPSPPAASPESRDPFLDPIPSGRFSGSLPWLRVTGNRVTNIFGDPILLRGVTLLGMDGAPPHPQLGFSAGAGLGPEAITQALSWGANVLRLAINRSRVLHGYEDWSAWDYLSDLDQIISQAAAAGAYTLLSLRRLDDVSLFGTLLGPSGESLPNYIAPMPDYDSIGMWRVLGERYASEPAVLFDLYTAPHPALPDDLSGFTTDWDLWTLWVQVIAADLRRLHPRALIFVSGLEGGTNLSGFPILGTAGDPVPNLVYTTHMYPRQPDPLPAMRSLVRSHPLFVTEWGGSRSDLLWGERTELALRSLGVGWTAACWNAAGINDAGSNDVSWHAAPPLTQLVRTRLAPTPFGALVQRALALTVETPLTVQPPLPAGLSDFIPR